MTAKSGRLTPYDAWIGVSVRVRVWIRAWEGIELRVGTRVRLESRLRAQGRG